MSSSISGDLAGESRLLFESAGRAALGELRPGQRIPARVIETLLTGDVLLELGASRAVVRANAPLQLGQRVVLEVVSGGAAPELRIVTDKSAATPQPATPQAATTPQAVTPQALIPQALIPQAAAPQATTPLTATPQAATPQAATPQAVAPQATPLQTAISQAAPQALTPQAVTPQAAIPEAMTPPAAAAQPQGAADAPAALSPRDLPVILRALADLAPTGAAPGNASGTATATATASAVPLAQAGHTFLQAAAAADLRPAVVEQIQRLLAPLQTALPPAELAPALRAFLSQSGLFFENHLAAALLEHEQSTNAAPGAGVHGEKGARPGSLTADRQHPATDIRLLLGELTTADTPVPDPVRAFGEAILQQQVGLAAHLAATGSGQVAIPLLFGDERVDLRFTWDREARQGQEERAEPDDGQAISLGVFVNLHVFGAIEARIVWKRASFAVTFYVEREATRAIVDAGLSDLSKELSESGFPAVATNVWLNPDRVAAGVTPVKPAIPGGTILDVRV